MKLITERDKIIGVSKAWDATYASGSYGDDKLVIGDRLRALKLKSATAADIKDIIGNDTWTSLKCDECEKNVTVVVQVGDESDYESPTVCLCVKCAKKTAKLAAQQKGE